MKAQLLRPIIKKQIIICFFTFFAIFIAKAQFEEQDGISLPKLCYSAMAWGDYNNDGFMDLLLTGDPGDYNYISKIYKNNGDGTFTEQTGIQLIGVTRGAVAWGDYNNDGFLDILLTGYAKTGSISIIYKNNGEGNFIEQKGINLIPVEYSSVAWGDYNNDGRLDILLSGNANYSDGGYISKIYKNNGDGTFSDQTNALLSETQYGSVAWGDYNNDGYLDILLTGSSNLVKIYKNNGDGTFSDQTSIFLRKGTISGLGSWVDYNNDGFLDVFLIRESTYPYGGELTLFKNNGNETFSEHTSFNYMHSVKSIDIGDYDNNGFSDILWTSNSWDSTYIYKNNGDETYSLEPFNSFPYYGASYALWIDYDKDDKLDILNIGCSSLFSSKFYKNVSAILPNTPPLAPNNLRDSINFNNAILKWDKTTDAQTTQNGLSYNIRVGTTPGGSDIVNPMASTTSGDRKINALGNACQKNDGFILKNLPTGTYFWSVQAIDNSFAGGSWATENTFTISAGQASNLVTDSIGLAGIKLSWTNGSGDKRIVLMAEGSKSTVALPLNGISYIANSSFGSGTQIGSSDWYCIYNDTGSNITVTNLKEYAIYSIAVFEYNGDPGKENYNASTFKENVAFAKTKSIFEEQTDIFLIGLKNSSAAWGDYNNDGFLDILMTGDSSTRSIKKPVTIIYKNNGNEIFTEQTGISVPGVINGSVAWGDYNNDGLLDIAITGDTGTVSSSPMSKIYKSNGDGTFSEQAGIHLTGLSNSSLAWNDFNNDGLLDLVLCGNTGNYYIAKIYKNNGDGTFSEQTIIDLNEVDLMYSTGGKNNIAVNDYNNDGFKDILLAEYNTNSNYPYIAKIYKNNGDGTFVKQNEITGLSGSSVAWGDYNNDGWLDILLTAHIGAPVYYGSKIYKNNGDGTFSEQTGVSLPGAYQGSVAWGDYNNDGYLDILALSGPSNLFPTTRIYKNNGDGTFSVQNGISLPNLNQASIAWGDYNSDSYLDILLTGSGVTKIYKNIGTYSTNSIANAPGNLHQKINFNNIKLKWDKASDAQTPQNGLNYNIRVGTTPGNCNILNPMASVANGYRRIPAIGNAGQKNDTLTLNLPAGTYYWSVQAIDNAYAGGAWATENTFTITSQQTSNIALDSLSLSAMKLSWTNGNGDKRVVFATHGNNTVTIPTNNTTYSPNDTFGIGSQIGTSGWYCVYNSDTGNKVTVKGIEGIMEFPFLQFYKVAVFDYSGTPGNEIYNTSISNGNLISVETKQLFEEQKGISFTRYCDASAWGDYNNDGWLDVIVTGYFGPFCPAAIYKNNGDGTFTEQTGISLKGVGRDCSVAWGDYNNDNYLDLVLSGYRGHGNGSGTALYKNNGDGTFSEQTSTSFKVGLLTWRDYNNDGFLDLQIDSNIYKNNGDGTFSLQTGITLPDISAAGIDYNNDGVSEPIGSATWVDYDNDGYVDKFSGYKIYKNNGAYVPYPKNTPPTAPTNLKTSIDFNSATLEWDKATDIITPQDQLSYNVRIGTSPEAYDVVSPEASTVNGVRWIPAIGNAGQTTGYSINNLPSGTYYWSVQAIDNAFAGGEWATENTFTITANQASNIVADNIGISKMSLSWTNGSCDRRIVLMSENNNEIAPPVNNNTTYLAKSIFGEGTQIGTSGWYCVYNGTENEVTVSGLKDGTNYSIAVLEYNGTTGNENYNTNTSAENPVVIMTKCAYEEQTEISLAGSSPTAWGDYNNDGFLDILSTAYTDTSSILKIYKNNGDGTFSEGTCISITGQSFGSAQWIDYNNDGLIDILLTGNCNTYYSEITPTILKNNGDGSFTELTETSFPSVYASSEAWGDYNNDGLGDIIIVGHILNAEDTLPRIYKNNGNGTFTKQTVVLKGIGYFPVAWGDMNKDGSLDILIADTISNNVFLRIYINDGNGNFIEKSNNLQINIGWGSAMVLGDYNNDGLLDILLSGQDSNADWVTKIYKNNGDETFSEVTGISLPSVQYSSLTWGDYNHDGLLDVLISGYFLENTYDWVPKTRIYKNNGDETFSEQSNIYLPGIIGNSTWGDYDNDGLLDILIGSNIYKNIGEYSLNNGPSAPTNLTQTVNSKTVLLEWSQASDDQTPQNGLSYNARIGKIPSDVDVVSPMTSVTDGFRRIPAIGNTGQTNKYVINNLPDGTYYWSVQAIDNAWVGGQWAKEKMFCVSDNCVDAINPATINKIMIYPNPTKDYVKIVSDIVEPYMVTITDLNGKNVLCQQIKTSEQTMHLNNLESGLYIVKLQTNSGIFVIKLIVE